MRFILSTWERRIRVWIVNWKSLAALTKPKRGSISARVILFKVALVFRAIYKSHRALRSMLVLKVNPWLILQLHVNIFFKCAWCSLISQIILSYWNIILLRPNILKRIFQIFLIITYWWSVMSFMRSYLICWFRSFLIWLLSNQGWVELCPLFMSEEQFSISCDFWHELRMLRRLFSYGSKF